MTLGRPYVTSKHCEGLTRSAGKGQEAVSHRLSLTEWVQKEAKEAGETRKAKEAKEARKAKKTRKAKQTSKVVTKSVTTDPCL